jgi:8-oxo-dGTP diphosphatase
MLKHTVDCLIAYQDGIVLIEREHFPFGLALPGGKVEENETLEEAVVREMLEETHLRLSDLRQFRTYSAPDRDPRFRAISTVFVAQGHGTLRAGDDAKRARVVSWDDIGRMQSEFAFDHYKILCDYRREYCCSQ